MSVCASHLLKERVLCILSTISLKKEILNFYYFKKKVHKDERNAAFFFKPGRRILILGEQTKGKEFFYRDFACHRALIIKRSWKGKLECCRNQYVIPKQK